MRNFTFFSCILVLLFTFSLSISMDAQVRHGGQPLPLSLTRSTEELSYEEMPTFDVEEEMRLDSLNETDLRNGYRFAYKFVTNYNRYNSGTSFTLADGTKVWRLGIYSPGALSINLLFTEYNLPEGAQLFLYNEDQTQVLGAFTHQNNSDLQILPASPLPGDRIIVEYQEPANASFQGQLTVGEVNHAYRSLFRLEPEDDSSTITDIPPLACYPEEDYLQWGHGVVLLIIDGTTGCTGCLLNNTENDGRPYLLTASHCLNGQFKVKNPDYETVAGRIICFFNYNSPFCDPITRGTEELSTASGYSRVVDEHADVALLELTETPPAYYQPYYLGWNAGETGSSPYTCLQHPQYSVKRISITDSELTPITFTDPNMTFYTYGHWHVKLWDVGYTASGSSGSPLINTKGEVIGGLSGGVSEKSDPSNDYFFSLETAWDSINTEDNSLQLWLNPTEDGNNACSGLDPYQSTPTYRLSNVYDSGNQENAESTLYPGSDTIPLFGNNSDGINEYAEAYQINEEVTIYGAYLVTRATGSNYEKMDVEITVYSGDSEPTTLLYTETFQPTYLSLENDSLFVENNKSLNRSQESFITFAEPVKVTGPFYIGYKINSIPNNTYFAAYNLPEGTTTHNTAWVFYGDEWIPASAYSAAGFSTSLFIDPVVQYGNPVNNEQIELSDTPQIFLGTEKGTVHVILPDGVEQADYTLYSARGQTLRNGQIAYKQATLYFGKLTSGFYLLTLNYEDRIYTQKLIF